LHRGHSAERRLKKAMSQKRALDAMPPSRTREAPRLGSRMKHTNPVNITINPRRWRDEKNTATRKGLADGRDLARRILAGSGLAGGLSV
jgi:hypothetical protein